MRVRYHYRNHLLSSRLGKNSKAPHKFPLPSLTIHLEADTETTRDKIQETLTMAEPKGRIKLGLIRSGLRSNVGQACKEVCSFAIESGSLTILAR